MRMQRSLAQNQSVAQKVHVRIVEAGADESTLEVCFFIRMIALKQRIAAYRAESSVLNNESLGQFAAANINIYIIVVVYIAVECSL